MRIITKIVLPVIFLSMSLGAVAAQEPIPEIQWQKAGTAFMAGLDPRFGTASVASHLPQSVARDIVESIKPKEEYGFIKNFTDKQIVKFRMITLGLPTYMKYYWDIITAANSLASKNRLHLITETNKQDTTSSKDCVFNYQWGRHVCLASRDFFQFDIVVQFQDGPEMLIMNVLCSDLMNLNVFKEGKYIRLEVSCPYSAPASYFPSLLKS